jgi:hypothetical protein
MDVAFEMSKLTREIILKIMFGVDLASDGDETIEIERYSLQLAPGARVEPEPLFTLQPRNGIPMTLHPMAERECGRRGHREREREYA